MEYVLMLVLLGIMLVYRLMSLRSDVFSTKPLGYDILLHSPTLLFTGLVVFRYFYWLYKRNDPRVNWYAIFLPNAMALMGIMICLLIHPLNIVLFGTSPTWQQQVGFAVVSNIVLMLGVGALYLFARNVLTHNRLYKAEAEKAHYQMDALRMQVQPHFLYNALNTAAALTHEDGAKAERFLQELSSVYRYLTKRGSEQTVTLREEMEFTRAYIYLQSIRFEDKLCVDIHVADTLLEQLVVPVSVQMLVGNALKHNMHTTKQPLHITINATEEGIEVSNNIQRRTEIEGTGNGLKNLNLQYKNLGKSIEVKDDGTTFRVMLPYVDEQSSEN